MDFETLKSMEPFFSDRYLTGVCDETGEYTLYYAERTTQAGKKELCCIRSYFVECENADTPGMSYPLKMRRLLNDIDTMKKLSRCKDVLSFRDDTVLRSSNGFTVLILTEYAEPLTKKTDVCNLGKADAMKICLSVCGACESFRSIDIATGKICPENIFVKEDGSYVLGDFGIGGKYLPDEDYTAPQNYGKGIDDRTYGDVDIYALGMLFYKLLNHNRAPFMPSYPIPISEFNRENAVKRRINGEITGFFEGSLIQEESVVLKACAFDPKERYKNISTLKSDIKSCLRAVEPIPERPVSEVGKSGLGRGAPPTRLGNKTVSEGEEAQRLVDRERELAYQQELAAAQEETKKAVTKLIAAISCIAVVGAVIFGILLYRERIKPIPGQPEQSSGEITTDAPTQSTPQTTVLTTLTTVPPTEITTQPPEESTEMPATVPSTALPPITEQPSTQAIPEDTTETSAEESSTEEQYYTLPELFTPVNVKNVNVRIFKDSGRIDEILIILKHSFGENVRSTGNAVLYEYNNGNVLGKRELEFNCYYDTTDGKEVTVCDFIIPDGVEIDRGNCNYELQFPKSSIMGTGFINNEFVAKF